MTPIDTDAENEVIIYTDGGCRGNPGLGGWGALLLYRGKEKELSGSAEQTTNNQMELTAAIQALRSLKRSCRITLITDSVYVKNGITEWIDNWRARGWRNASGKPVKNKELWLALDEARAPHEVTWRWVKGHAGDEGNERVDALANEAMDALERELN